MPTKCSHCGKTFVRFPLKDSNGKIIWKNLFKMDLMSIILIIVIANMIIGYKLDMKKCDDAIKDPCKFCDYTNCCQIDYGHVDTNELIEKNLVNINFTGNV